MIMFFKHRINRVSVQIGFISFVIGHLLFLSYLFLQDDIWIGVVLAFLMLFFGFHIILLIILFVNLLMHFKNYEEHIFALIPVFLNLPLALFYISLF
jgi:hypothetical protein